MITMKHKLAYIEAKALPVELNLMTRSHFIEILMILTKYVFDLGVRLTEFSVTVESVTLRFYCTYHIQSHKPMKTQTFNTHYTTRQSMTNTHMKISLYLGWP